MCLKTYLCQLLLFLSLNHSQNIERDDYSYPKRTSCHLSLIGHMQVGSIDWKRNLPAHLLGQLPLLQPTTRQ
jgi:hypothetical protein